MIPGIVAGQLQAVVVPTTDPHWASVTSLVHFDDSTTVVDLRGHAWTLERGAGIDTAQRRFGVSSLILPSAGTSSPGTASAASTPFNSGFLLGAEDFTVELFVRLTALPAGVRGYIAAVYNTRTNNRSWSVTVSAAGAFDALLSTDGVTAITMAGSVSAVPGQFHHVALCRGGTTMRLWVDGVQAAIATSPGTLYAVPEPLVVGGQSSGSFGINGHVDELRITKGVCRYTAPFVPPTAPFPNS